ncbi:hypothetical protein [Arthrobacter sp. JSM 101049]|uniref:hypothetical protein n=1 Tax=Arthrobacter sp. JSM 101049 TaxID=929097 RepID=UPI0035621217
MMPWWFWILLWVVLALATLVFLGLCALHLYRRFMALAQEVGTAGDALVLPPGEPLEEDRRTDPLPAVGVAALFRSPEVARAEYDAGKLARRRARRDRRVAGKRARGRAQRVRDLYPRDVDL